MTSSSQKISLKKFLPPSTNRVEKFSRSKINSHIQARIQKNVQLYASNPGGIEKRLAQLDREWDTERVIELQTALTVFGCATVAWILGWHWMLQLPTMLAMFFLAQHAIVGWSPAVWLLRLYDFRTPTEILEEKVALKMVRGDFGEISEATVRDVVRVSDLHPEKF